MRLFVVYFLISFLSIASVLPLDARKTYQPFDLSRPILFRSRVAQEQPLSYCDWQLPEEEQERNKKKRKKKSDKEALITLACAAGIAVLVLYASSGSHGSLRNMVFLPRKVQHCTGASIELIDVVQQVGAECGYHALYNGLYAASELSKNPQANLKEFLVAPARVQEINQLWSDGYKGIGSVRQDIIQNRVQEKREAFPGTALSKVVVPFYLKPITADVEKACLSIGDVLKEGSITGERRNRTPKETADMHQGAYKTVLQESVKELYGKKGPKFTPEELKNCFLRNVKNKQFTEDGRAVIFSAQEMIHHFINFDVDEKVFSECLQDAQVKIDGECKSELGDWLTDLEMIGVVDKLKRKIDMPDVQYCIIPAQDRLQRIANPVLDGSLLYSRESQAFHRIIQQLNARSQGAYCFVLGTMDAVKAKSGHWYALVVQQKVDGRSYFVFESSSNNACYIQPGTFAYDLVDTIEQKLLECDPTNTPAPSIVVTNTASTRPQQTQQSALKMAGVNIFKFLREQAMLPVAAIATMCCAVLYKLYTATERDKVSLQEVSAADAAVPLPSQDHSEGSQVWVH